MNPPIMTDHIFSFRGNGSMITAALVAVFLPRMAAVAVTRVPTTYHRHILCVDAGDAVEATKMPRAKKG